MMNDSCMDRPLTNTHSSHWTRLALSLVLSLMALHGPDSFALAFTKVDDVIELDSPSEKPSVELTDPVTHLETPLKGTLSQQAIGPQDQINLDMLWGAVVDQNPIIQFGLKRLATPPEHREAHNSTMARVVGSLITGAGMLPYAFGAGELGAGLSAVGSSLANRALFKIDESELRELPSDRELVELSSLIQELQHEVVQQYFAYKAALSILEAYGPHHQETLSAGAPDDVNAQFHRIEYQLAHQQAKQHLILLTRLVGPEAIKRLHFQDLQANQSSDSLPGGSIHQQLTSQLIQPSASQTLPGGHPVP